MRKNQKTPVRALPKKAYKAPILNPLGSVQQLTLKLGSAVDTAQGFF